MTYALIFIPFFALFALKPLSLKISVIVIDLIIFVFLKKGDLLFAPAVRAITTGRGDEKQWKRVEKARKLGLSDRNTLVMASLYIQKDDWRKGEEILDRLIEKCGSDSSEKTKKILNTARTMRSMTYWLSGDLDKAIDAVQALYDEGYKEKNAMINLGTYLLEAGYYSRMKTLIQECSGTEGSSAGLTDNHGWYALVTGRWDEAEKLMKKLMDSEPSFPEPYVHSAQVHLHYGEIEQAVELLKRGQNVRFTNTSGVKKPFIEKLIALLDNPETAEKTALLLNRNVDAVARGEFPSEDSKNRDTGFAQRESREKVFSDTDERTDEDIPDTSITEEDERYLQSLE